MVVIAVPGPRGPRAVRFGPLVVDSGYGTIPKSMNSTDTHL